MHLAGDGPALRSIPRPESEQTARLLVTPANVVALAALFNECANLLGPISRQLETDLRLVDSWLHDPVSAWARGWFNDYFVGCSVDSFAGVVADLYRQLSAMAGALQNAAANYGLTEELNTALVRAAGPR